MDQNNREKMIMKDGVFGYHLILDLYDCDLEPLESLNICYNYLNDMIKIVGVHPQSAPMVVITDGEAFPDKAGISGWVPIVESGFTIHTLTPTRFVSIDIYSCKKYSIEKVVDFTKKIFNPKSIDEKFFLRGERYVAPAL